MIEPILQHHERIAKYERETSKPQRGIYSDLSEVDSKEFDNVSIKFKILQIIMLQ